MSSSLYFIGQQITIYIGIPILIGGILGGCLNIIVFMSLRTFRESSCAFYLTILSLMNIGQLLTGLLSRILITGFNIDWTRSSLFYCKLRPFLTTVCSLISSTCLCLATLDQYFATSTRIQWQQWCNIKVAHRLVIICSILCLIEEIPTLFFYEHVVSPVNNQIICIITNPGFSQYNIYFTLLMLWFFTPLFFTVFFASLAYRNVQQMAHRTQPLVRRELDKQLTVMVLVQVLVDFITVLPNLIIYLLLINDSLRVNPLFVTGISFANMIGLCVFYAAFSSPFYIYLCASERFRRQLIYVIFNIHLNRIQNRLVVVNQVAALA